MTHRPRKRFGQNFLHDPTVIERIVRAIAPVPGQGLVEIGPGEGALTLPLLASGARLTVIELDRDPAAQLAGTGEADAGSLAAAIEAALPWQCGAPTSTRRPADYQRMPSPA